MKCTQRLCLTADKKRVVPEGDPKAAFLYATPGDEIPDSAAEMFGLVDGGLPKKAAKTTTETKPAAKRKPSAKPKPAASDKEKPASETKES
jgi:hypothetical protein